MKEMLRGGNVDEQAVQGSAGSDSPPGIKMAGDEHSTVYRIRSYDELLYVLQRAWSSGSQVRVYVRDGELGIWMLCSEPVEENGIVVCKDNPLIKFTELGSSYPMAYVVVRRAAAKDKHKVVPRANLLRQIMEKEMRVKKKGEEREAKTVVMIPEFSDLVKSDLSLSSEVAVERVRIRRRRKQAKR